MPICIYLDKKMILKIIIGINILLFKKPNNLGKLLCKAMRSMIN